MDQKLLSTIKNKNFLKNLGFSKFGIKYLLKREDLIKMLKISK